MSLHFAFIVVYRHLHFFFLILSSYKTSESFQSGFYRQKFNHLVTTCLVNKVQIDSLSFFSHHHHLHLHLERRGKKSRRGSSFLRGWIEDVVKLSWMKSSFCKYNHKFPTLLITNQSWGGGHHKKAQKLRLCIKWRDCRQRERLVMPVLHGQTIRKRVKELFFLSSMFIILQKTRNLFIIILCN